MGQAWQCAVPDRLPALAPVRQDGPTVKAPIAGYTLAVSWSPEFCRADRDPGSVQCSGRNGRFGFILHGLWPEAAVGQAPQWCALQPRPAPETIRQNLCTTPAPRLIEHEWARHGSCMATTPEAYWAIARHVFARFRWPDMAALSRQPGLTTGALRDAIARANPGLPREAVGLVPSDRGWLRELRICHNRQYRAVACRRDLFGPADRAGLKIWRGT
jgi:ribonuclease T2